MQKVKMFKSLINVSCDEQHLEKNLERFIADKNIKIISLNQSIAPCAAPSNYFFAVITVVYDDGK